MRFLIIKIKISINFMHLQGELTSEIRHKVENLGRKTKQYCPKTPTFPPFS